VLDERRRVQVDARHGRPAVRTLDEDTARKVMGGKDRALRPDTSNALLRAIGIMNADGSDLRQPRPQVQAGQPPRRAVRARPGSASSRPAPRDEAHPLRVLDLACGNAYLSFVLAESLRLAGVPLRLHGVDVRDDVVLRSRERAAQLGMPHLGFARATIAEAETSAITALGGPPDIVLALHACDTATDEALALAIRLGTPAILCVPCCQHELAAQLAAAGASPRSAPAATSSASPPTSCAASSPDRPRMMGPRPSARLHVSLFRLSVEFCEAFHVQNDAADDHFPGSERCVHAHFS
jgi:hypothetical protein